CGDAPLQDGEQVVRGDLAAAQEIHDAAGIRAKEIGGDGRPPMPLLPPSRRRVYQSDIGQDKRRPRTDDADAEQIDHLERIVGSAWIAWTLLFGHSPGLSPRPHPSGRGRGRRCSRSPAQYRQTSITQLIRRCVDARPMLQRLWPPEKATRGFKGESPSFGRRTTTGAPTFTRL